MAGSPLIPADVEAAVIAHLLLDAAELEIVGFAMPSPHGPWTVMVAHRPGRDAAGVMRSWFIVDAKRAGDHIVLRDWGQFASKLVADEFMRQAMRHSR
jgi:hypothetical protein